MRIEPSKDLLQQTLDSMPPDVLVPWTLKGVNLRGWEVEYNVMQNKIIIKVGFNEPEEV